MITNEEYIRKAVELADGWRLDYPFDGEVECIFETDDFGSTLANPAQIILDALAAQLVRQVDATDKFEVFTTPSYTIVYESVGHGKQNPYQDMEGDDRTMNTIKAIVDSGVLEKESE